MALFLWGGGGGQPKDDVISGRPLRADIELLFYKSVVASYNQEKMMGVSIIYNPIECAVIGGQRALLVILVHDHKKPCLECLLF